ncbi:hypothetical protein [Bradyrhizobium sp.]|uniref:hypothetical protein n=1 Tax=Bradyrhizobium sp. TaxID=376 RepID=UPI001ECE3DD3|nr:hypothetical protein [Bradyrhizobium sp.]MBV9979965.1 hypothetical protein [Bradyrhizobium sp.]
MGDPVKRAIERLLVPGSGALLRRLQRTFESGEMLVIPSCRVRVVEAAPMRARTSPDEEAIELAIGPVLALIFRCLRSDAHQRVDARIHETVGQRIVRAELGSRNNLAEAFSSEAI